MERISDIDIESLIPQREPMLMVSGLHSASDKSITTWFQVEPGNIFVEKGKFRESGLIENIAQTAAALNGYRARLGGEPVKNGYIGALKNLKIFYLPEVGVRLTTSVEETHQVLDASIILGEVKAADQLIARCEMKIFIQA